MRALWIIIRRANAALLDLPTLAAKPKLIFCDEVASAFDPLVAQGILAAL